MIPKYKILFVSHLGYGSTGLQRMNALRDIGQDIIPFDYKPYWESGSRIVRVLQGRFQIGPSVRSLNADLVSFANRNHCDIIWIEKGTWIYPETVARLRGSVNTLLVHFTPDAAIVYNRTRHFLRSVRLYDIVVTTKRFEVDKYREYGAKKVILIGKCFDPTIHKPYNLSAEELRMYQSEVCFIGHCEKHYLDLAKAASSTTEHLAIRGSQWAREKSRHPWLQNAYRGGNIWGTDYGKALSSAKICLGFLSKLFPETSTARTIEIPACGTMLIAERTDEHLELFDEGKEAEFFDCPEELTDKIRFYLRHSEIRQRIAAAGIKRCLTSNYSNQGRLEYVLREITRTDRPDSSHADM